MVQKSVSEIYFRLIKILYKRFEFVKVLLLAKWRCPELFVIIFIVITTFSQRTMLWWWRQTLLQFSGRLTSKFFFVIQRLCWNLSIDLVWKKIGNKKRRCDENAVLYHEIYVIVSYSGVIIWHKLSLMKKHINQLIACSPAVTCWLLPPLPSLEVN